MHYEDFAKSLKKADIIFLAEIYPAREKPIPGVTSQLIYDLLKEDSTKKVFYIKELDELNRSILNIIEKGDILVFMGAGNITTKSHEIISII